MKRVKYCKDCDRKLTTKISRERGYGPTCYAKRPSMHYKELERKGQLRFDLK